MDKSILDKIDAGHMEGIRNLQMRTLSGVFNKDRLNRLMEAEAMNGSDAYSLIDLFQGVTDGIFSEVDSNGNIDPFRRNLQRGYVDQMESLMKLEGAAYSQSDIKAMARGYLKSVLSRLNGSSYTSGANGFHIDDLKARIEQILDPK